VGERLAAKGLAQADRGVFLPDGAVAQADKRRDPRGVIYSETFADHERVLEHRHRRSPSVARNVPANELNLRLLIGTTPAARVVSDCFQVWRMFRLSGIRSADKDMPKKWNLRLFPSIGEHRVIS
jgi:hypothetical protein